MRRPSRWRGRGLAGCCTCCLQSCRSSVSCAFSSLRAAGLALRPPLVLHCDYACAAISVAEVYCVLAQGRHRAHWGCFQVRSDCDVSRRSPQLHRAQLRTASLHLGPASPWSLASRPSLYRLPSLQRPLGSAVVAQGPYPLSQQLHPEQHSKPPFYAIVVSQHRSCRPSSS